MESIHEMDSIREEGTVIQLNGNMATVRIDKASACAHCKAGCVEQGGSMITEASAATTIDVKGTADIVYSSAAIDTANNSFLIPKIVSWQEVY